MTAISVPLLPAAAASDSQSTVTRTNFAMSRSHHAVPNLPRSQGRKASVHAKGAWVLAILLVVAAATIAYTASSSSTATISMVQFWGASSASLGPVRGGATRLPTAQSQQSATEVSNLESMPSDSLSFSPLLLMTGAGSHGLLPMIRRDALLSILVKPLVVELGAVVLCQAVGLPLLSKLGVILRRMRVQGTIMGLPHGHHVLSATRGMRNLLSRRFPPAARRLVVRNARVVTTRTGKAWKTFGHVYKQTSLSKIVNRSKKLLKVFVVHKDLHDDGDNEGHH